MQCTAVASVHAKSRSRLEIPGIKSTLESCRYHTYQHDFVKQIALHLTKSNINIYIL